MLTSSRLTLLGASLSLFPAVALAQHPVGPPRPQMPKTRRPPPWEPPDREEDKEQDEEQGSTRCEDTSSASSEAQDKPCTKESPKQEILPSWALGPTFRVSGAGLAPGVEQRPFYYVNLDLGLWDDAHLFWANSAITALLDLLLGLALGAPPGLEANPGEYLDLNLLEVVMLFRLLGDARVSYVAGLHLGGRLHRTTLRRPDDLGVLQFQGGPSLGLIWRPTRWLQVVPLAELGAATTQTFRPEADLSSLRSNHGDVHDREDAERSGFYAGAVLELRAHLYGPLQGMLRYRGLYYSWSSSALPVRMHGLQLGLVLGTWSRDPKQKSPQASQGAAREHRSR